MLLQVDDGQYLLTFADSTWFSMDWEGLSDPREAHTDLDTKIDLLRKVICFHLSLLHSASKYIVTSDPTVSLASRHLSGTE